MFIEREKLAKQISEEQKLRQYVRKAIKVVKERRTKQRDAAILEEQKLRSVIRDLIKETKVSDTEESPHRSTGINVLEDLLKKIVPIIETDYKKLTTDKAQRDSYRAHILHAIENSLAPPKAMDSASASAGGDAGEDNKFINIREEDVNIKVGDDEDPEEFIDVRGEKEAEEEVGDPEKDEFSLSGQDETGRDMAFDTFKRIEASILDSWEVLYSDEDKELFFDYLITNFKLYFDKFEDELQPTLPEPTTPEYEREKGQDDLGEPVAEF